MNRMLGRADARPVAARKGVSGASAVAAASAASAVPGRRTAAAAVVPSRPPRARREGDEDTVLLGVEGRVGRGRSGRGPGRGAGEAAEGWLAAAAERAGHATEVDVAAAHEECLSRTHVPIVRTGSGHVNGIS
jgi:hypothetical protein